MTALYRDTRAPAWVVAALVLGLTFTCVRRAHATWFVPNQLEYSFALAEGQRQIFPLATSNSPVLLTVSGTPNSSTSRTCFAHVTHHPGTGSVSWVGMNVDSTGTAGDSNVSGTVLVAISPHIGVQVHNVSATARQLRIAVGTPGFGAGMRGVVQQIW